MSSGFERRREQSRQDIRHAAFELFGQYGVEKVAIADIARKAGVSPATIYNNFDSKEAIVREFVRTAVDGLQDQIEQVLMPEKPFRDKMAAFMGFIAEMLAHGEPLETGATIFTSGADLQHDPEIRKIRDGAREKMTALLLELAAEGKAQGQVSRHASDEALRVYFGAFMDAFVDPALHRRFSAQPGLIQELGALMLDGLSGPR